MKKILATTDLSQNSKAAIRLAIRLAETFDFSLTVVHISHIAEPYNFTAGRYQGLVRLANEKLSRELSCFVSAIYRSMNKELANFESLIINSTHAMQEVSAYALAHKFEYVLISTRGAGPVKKLFGTNTSMLMSLCKVPLICVPASYRFKGIHRITYASDLEDLEGELPYVISFAKPTGAKLEIVSIKEPFQGMSDPQETGPMLSAKFHYPIKYFQLRRNILYPLIEEIHHFVIRRPAGILVLFSHNERSGISKILFPSNAEQYSFYARIPILVFNKGDR